LRSLTSNKEEKEEKEEGEKEKMGWDWADLIDSA